MFPGTESLQFSRDSQFNYLQIPLLPTNINPENLGHFVSDIKSNLRKEFSALMAMADVEEALAETAQQLANHPSMFAASRKRFYF